MSRRYVNEAGGHFEVIKALANAVYDRGGDDGDLELLRKDKALCDRVADLIDEARGRNLATVLVGREKMGAMMVEKEKPRDGVTRFADYPISDDDGDCGKIFILRLGISLTPHGFNAYLEARGLRWLSQEEIAGFVFRYRNLLHQFDGKKLITRVKLLPERKLTGASVTYCCNGHSVTMEDADQNVISVFNFHENTPPDSHVPFREGVFFLLAVK